MFDMSGSRRFACYCPLDGSGNATEAIVQLFAIALVRLDERSEIVERHAPAGFVVRG